MHMGNTSKRFLFMTGFAVFTSQPFRTYLSHGKIGNRKVQLVLQHCFVKMLHVLPPRIKPVLQQIRLLQAQGPGEMCLSLEHQNSYKTSEKMGYFDRVTVSLHILYTASQETEGSQDRLARPSVALRSPFGRPACASEDMACGY